MRAINKDLWAALDQAKRYARTYKKNTGHDIPLLFASDGMTYLRQNLKANTLPEHINNFPTIVASLPKCSAARLSSVPPWWFGQTAYTQDC